MRPINRLRRSASSPDSTPRRRTQPSAPPFQVEPHFFISAGNDSGVEDPCGFSCHTDSTIGTERRSYLDSQTSPDCWNDWVDLGGEG
jgi:hypothetical protein